MSWDQLHYTEGMQCMWLAAMLCCLRLCVLKAGQFFMFVAAEVMITVMKTNMLHATNWWTLLIISLHKVNSCWYYHMRSVPSEVCMCMLPRSGCICTACGHL